MIDESDPIEALDDLGLTGYEARVFVALQRLGIGTASDVDRISDVPRSQVYGAAEKLQERGLIEVQQSNPLQYRPVDLEEAREQLRTRYEQREETAFRYLEDVQTNGLEADERQEDVWTLYGEDSIARRTNQLVDDATEQVLYGCDTETLDSTVASKLRQTASNKVDVTVVSVTREVLDQFETEGITVHLVPEEITLEPQTGRILVVDNDTLLLSILDDEELPGVRNETAIWSAETGFATVVCVYSQKITRQRRDFVDTKIWSFTGLISNIPTLSVGLRNRHRTATPIDN